MTDICYATSGYHTWKTDDFSTGSLSSYPRDWSGFSSSNVKDVKLMVEVSSSSRICGWATSLSLIPVIGS